MFEIIGLLIGTAILFSLSLVVGLVYAGIAFLILWKRPKRRILLMLVAASIPVCSTAYMWLCVALLPGESLFGDINQPLPNDYTLRALGKMPDFASIYQGNASSGPLLTSECIGRVAIDGPLVIGQYSHPFGSFGTTAQEPFFAFDTRTAHNVDYPTQSALQTALGHPITLQPTQFFQSSESRYIQQQRWHRIVLFAPPALITCAFFLILIAVRRSASARIPFCPLDPS